ncbi:MAG: hypothetical protein WDW38_006636 [Sanguina aurantia]
MVHHSFLLWQPAFIQTRRMMPTTLLNLNEGHGFSGTDTSMLEIAGHLVKRGHGVHVLSGGPATRRPGHDGISYMSPDRSYMDDPVQVRTMAAVSTLVLVYLTPESLGEMAEVMRRASNSRLRVVLWCHSLHLGAHEFEFVKQVCAARGAHLSVVGVSDFVREKLRPTLEACGLTGAYITIPNAVNPDLFTGEQGGRVGVREPRSMVFFASYERGGRIAKEVHARLGLRGLAMGGMHVFSYCDASITGLSKSSLARRLRTCDIFVYPLILDCGSVHHDTFACVVLEAMASGVLVVTWDVACLRGVYGDLITLVPTPICPGYDPASPVDATL